MPEIVQKKSLLEPRTCLVLTCARVAFTVQVDVDPGVVEITIKVFCFFLGKGTLGDDYTDTCPLARMDLHKTVSSPLTLESLLDIEGLLGTRFKVGDIVLGRTESHGPFRRDHALVLLDINLVTNHHLVRKTSKQNIRAFQDDKSVRGSHEWKSFRVPGTGLDEEFIPPTIQSLKTLRVVHIVHENAAIGSTIKRHSKRLKSFLTSRIPNLQGRNTCYHTTASYFLSHANQGGTGTEGNLPAL